MLHLPRLTEQDLQDYIRWQEQIKSSLERHMQTTNFAAHQESAIAVKNNFPPVQSDRLPNVVQSKEHIRAVDMVQSEEHVGSGRESCLSAIHTNELVWIAPEKDLHDL